MLWSEDFHDRGAGHRVSPLAESPGRRNTVREWFAQPRLNDPVAKLIVPDMGRQIRMLCGNEIMERVAEARTQLAGANADKRRDADQ